MLTWSEKNDRQGNCQYQKGMVDVDLWSVKSYSSGKCVCVCVCVYVCVYSMNVAVRA